MAWKLADAKNKLSEVIRRALEEGPQRIERRKDAVVVVAADEFDRLTGRKPGTAEFLMAGPDLSELDLERDRTPMRNFEARGSCSTPASSPDSAGRRGTQGRRFYLARSTVGAIDHADIHVSIVTMGEIAKGVALLPTVQRR